MIYLRWNAVVITNSADYTEKQVRDALHELRVDYSDNKGFMKRTDRSYINEWAVHALCYRLGIKKDRTKDADLEFDIKPGTKMTYNILGPVARFILSFC